MMPTVNDLSSPDMLKVLAFLLPAAFGIAALVLNLSRGFSTVGMVFIAICAAIAVYFAPDFIELF